MDKLRAQKRDVALEQSLHDFLQSSSAGLENFLADRQPSPSQQVQRHELLMRIAAAIDQLPEDQRDVVIHRDLLGTKVEEIAREMNKTEKAVAGLLLRGRRKLRELLGDSRQET